MLCMLLGGVAGLRRAAEAISVESAPDTAPPDKAKAHGIPGGSARHCTSWGRTGNPFQMTVPLSPFAATSVVRILGLFVRNKLRTLIHESEIYLKQFVFY